MGFDSYAAHSLMSSTGEQMGIVVALDRAALADQALTEALLKIFSARAAAEIERTRAEQSYREILDAAEDAIFVHDWDTGAIIDVSSKAADLFGYSRDDLKRLRIGDLSADVSPYTEADAMAHIERARQSDSPLRFDWRAKHRDGTLVWHEVTLKRALVGGHRRVLAFVRDVTERKAAADALQMRERQYRAIFDGSVDAMVLWNDKIRFVDVNRTFTEMYGFTREEVIGTGFDNRLPAEEVARRTACFVSLIESLSAQQPVPGISRAGGTPPSISRSSSAIRSSTASEFASEFVPKTASPIPWSTSQRQCRSSRSASGASATSNGVTTGASTPRMRFVTRSSAELIADIVDAGECCERTFNGTSRQLHREDVEDTATGSQGGAARAALGRAVDSIYGCADRGGDPAIGAQRDLPLDPT